MVELRFGSTDESVVLKKGVGISINRILKKRLMTVVGSTGKKETFSSNKQID
jgi:hypothetical protein